MRVETPDGVKMWLNRDNVLAIRPAVDERTGQTLVGFCDVLTVAGVGFRVKGGLDDLTEERRLV